MWSLKAAKRIIVLGGCLAAAYTQLTTSPATIEYVRSIGGNEFHVGILSALPTLMLFMQFVSAIVVNHLSSRRRSWFWTALVHRLLLLPTALGPWLVQGMSDEFWVWNLIFTTALNQSLLHFSSPLWLSWMGDYLPHKGLSTYWGHRQVWMQISAAISLCCAAFLVAKSGLGIQVAYSIMTIVGTVCGVVDLFLFQKVYEPPVQKAPSPKMREVFAEPFRNREFRRYISFLCFWNFAAMVGAPFISLYLLAEVGMDLFHVLLLWTISWVGGATLSRTLGRWADSHGSQPVLVMCVALKSSLMLALLLIPHEPTMAFWILAPIFMLDAVLNAGILIANNGFMIKNSPTENRTMYIAATQAVAGFVGGVTSIIGGAMMRNMVGYHWQIGSWTLGHFEIMFLASIILRWTAWGLTRYVHEPNARHTWDVVQELVSEMLDRLDLRPGLTDSAEIELSAKPVNPVPLPATRRFLVPMPKFFGRSRSRERQRV